MTPLVRTSLAALLLAAPALAQDAPPSFFVTSRGLGDGANLGGLAGADAHCAALAQAAGLAGTDWRAYLSTQGADAENARDRIGTGPWHNVRGDLIAQDADALHGPDVNITHETALDETGAPVPFVPVDDSGVPLPREERTYLVEHDILTGSQADGTAFPEGEDMTCSNWTANAEGQGSAMLGHHDRRGLEPGITPWNAAHPSRGCSQDNLISTAGTGRLYCFLAD
ncbi:hypothetical protein [Rubellimicrobium aerolatum]|uniref:Lectin n=1 Tax=Rubellimicrobium aerolatum TaxID=490979 RepID=A0ABW0SD90_9RHOB|nr:hypothetical protein [Rubellimicrobium aerolatum]MBP1806564.1 hypothetical protein [Rubellimicrobium aerolatum]